MESAPARLGARVGPKACMSDETDAKSQLSKRRSSYSASQKKECVGESSEGGERGYGELLTCLEMATGHIT